MDAIPAFWFIYAAHLVADYPLQPTWMVQAKSEWLGRLAHTFVHLAVMLFFVGMAGRAIWPFLLVLAVVHYGLDTAKARLALARPGLVIAPYVLDQLWHALSVLAVSELIGTALPASLFPVSQPLAVFVAVFTLATYSWFITERVLWHEDAAYVACLNEQRWQRMVARGAMVVTLLLPLQRLPAQAGALAALCLLGLVLNFPYPPGPHRWRALVTDVVVSLLSAGLAWVAL